MGYCVEEVLGCNVCFLYLFELGQFVFNEVCVVLCDESEICVLLCNFCKDGYVFLNNFLFLLVCDVKGVVMYYVGIQDDVIEQEMMCMCLVQYVIIDLFMGLFNCMLLVDCVQQLVEMVVCQCSCFYVVFVNIDCFKVVNDSFGYLLGDEVLCCVVECLCDVVDMVDIVVCFGGDVFVLVILYVGLCGVDFGFDLFVELVCVEGYEVFVMVSIGVVEYLVYGIDVDSLICYVEMVMYYVKQNGCNCLEFFVFEMDIGVLYWLNLEYQIWVVLE